MADWQSILGQGADLGANYLLAQSLAGTQKGLGEQAATRAEKKMWLVR